MADLPFSHYRNKRVVIAPEGLEIEDRRVRLDETLDFGAPVGAVAARDLARAVVAHTALANGVCHPQLAAPLSSLRHATRVRAGWRRGRRRLQPRDRERPARTIAPLRRVLGRDARRRTVSTRIRAYARLLRRRRRPDGAQRRTAARPQPGRRRDLHPGRAAAVPYGQASRAGA